MSEKKSSIAFVVSYFGRFNNYFQLWLNSCAFNPSVDWLIFTDDRRSYNYPSNVHVTYTTLNEIKRRAESVLDCKICLERPYKLCDFKPFYGVIFADELKKYDFWGYCDVDLIWGNIRKFVTEDLLATNYKIFSYGHCTILRNIDIVNHFYLLETKGVVPWKKVVSLPYSFLYDEFDQINSIFEKFYPNNFYQGLAAFDANYNVRSLRPSKDTMHLMNAINTDYVFHWVRGQLIGLYIRADDTIGEQDFMYLHLQKRKMHYHLSQLNVKETYLILHDRFVRYTPVTSDSFKQLLPKRSIFPYRLKEHTLHAINVVLDNYTQRPYFRGKVSYWFDKLFGRTNKYDYRYRYK